MLKGIKKNAKLVLGEKKQKFLARLLKNKRLYLDGAMGSKLIALGKSTLRAEMLSLSDEKTIFDIHKSYLLAGSDIIYTNTFGANPKKYSLQELEKIIPKAISIAKRACDEFWQEGINAEIKSLQNAQKNTRESEDNINAKIKKIESTPRKMVAFSIGSLGVLLEPIGNVTFDEAYEHFATVAKILQACEDDVDCVVLETFGDLLELKAAILAFLENTTLPIMCSMTFEEGGRTFNGCSVECYAHTVQALGVSAVGINCSLGADKMLKNAKKLCSVAYKPLFIKPNAGLPHLVNGIEVYDTTPLQFAEAMAEIASQGIGILGGCCGTDERYIEQLILATKSIRKRKFTKKIDAVCSASRMVEFNKHLVVGERINPTGKPKLKQAIIDCDADYILELAQEQLGDGADILDINTGMAGIDETEKLAFLTKTVSVLQAPVQIDTTRVEALEKSLRLVCGVCIVNSVNAEQKSMDSVLPLVAKYGTYVVVLCLDENGIPANSRGRVALAKKVLAECKKYGISKEKLIIDPLTMAVSVDKNNALITLEALRKIVALRLKTTLGLSNVSFGLPAREVLNASFYELALKSGLSTAIVNPKIKASLNELALALLMGEDKNCEKYIKWAAETKGEIDTLQIKIETAADKGEVTQERDISECILRGLKGQGLKKIKEIVKRENPIKIIDTLIIPALNNLGMLYESGKVFLPQLIVGAECAKTMLDYIKENFISGGEASGEKMLLATVAGDIHDIGKNIVKAVLSNYGYEIVDLGRDVSIKKVIEAIREFKPKYVGLSALMTTTLDSMEKTVKAIKAEDENVIVMVGGAVVSDDFAKRIGADIYSENAQSLARMLKER